VPVAGPVAEDPLLPRLTEFFAAARPERLGVAVSGGGDSTALLHLLAAWMRAGGPAVSAVTVDHGLRPEAADEALAVGSACAGLGVPHQVLRWAWDGKGNFLDRARRGRYAAIAAWAKGQGIGTVTLGHTADDQAETFLMRLARGSGVDGLSPMAARRRSDGVEWVRPLLWVRREELRDWLKARGIPWAEDPTNDDFAYLRVRAREALGLLAPLGITREGLVATANRMGMAREVLDRAALALARQAVSVEAADVVIAAPAFQAAAFETQGRLLAYALQWVSGAEYRPRQDALMGLFAELDSGKVQTLSGCVVAGDGRAIRIGREPKAAAGARARVGEVWDGRWTVTGPALKGAEVRALGETGLARLDWRASGLSRLTLAATPAVWAGGRRIAAPVAEPGGDWRAVPTRGREDFLRRLIEH
jgi:tRNA(Ile)-lysidine synthase